MDWVAAGPHGPRYLFAEHAGARAAFTSRHRGGSRGPYGSLNLALHVGDARDTVLSNRASVMAAMGVAAGAWTCAEQVHGIDVAVVGRDEVGTGARERSPIVADALVTDVVGAALVVLVADCVPVLIVDEARPAIGAAHAGWRGVLGGVVEATLSAMGDRYGTCPADARVWVGPHIGACCYPVAPGRLEAFRARFGEIAVAGEDRLDLEACLRVALARAGVVAGSVMSTGLCTACDTQTFFSYRRAPRGMTGRLAGIAVLTGEESSPPDLAQRDGGL